MEEKDVKKGDKIEVIELADSDDEPRINVGDEGEVIEVIYNDVHTIGVDFGDGVKLNLLKKDDFKVIEEVR